MKPTDAAAVVKPEPSLLAKQMKEFFKNRPKAPAAIRRLRKNKPVTPKCAAQIINELYPSLKFETIAATNPASTHKFMTTCMKGDKLICTGFGNSKNEARNDAAEATLKQIVGGTLDQTELNETMTMAVDGEEIAPYQRLPWANLASLALHHMFSRWQAEGITLPELPSAPKPAQSEAAAGEQKKAGPVAPKRWDKKPDLPPNAASLHPTMLVNQLFPGLGCEVLEKDAGPPPRVTAGYRINDHLYPGTATNLKAARKEAAKTLLQSIYGLTFTV